jgi:hypothetical protein
LNNQSQALCKFKDQFILDGGLKDLKAVIEQSFEENEFDVYFYCLGCIPPLLFNSYFLFSQNKM